jgi:hypothetical protein
MGLKREAIEVTDFTVREEGNKKKMTRLVREQMFSREGKKRRWDRNDWFRIRFYVAKAKRKILQTT